MATRRPIIVQPVAHTHYRHQTRHVQHQGYDQRYQPRYRQDRSAMPGGFLTGLLFGGMLGSQQHRPYPADYRQTPDQLGTGQPMDPDTFESMMNAAFDGRQDSRVRMINGEEVPTTPGERIPITSEERRMFQQVMFNIMQRAGLPIDERAMFIPGILDDGQNPMRRGERGTHITHFNGDFTNPALGQMIDRNYDLLIDQYASEYQQYRGGMAQQPAPRYQQAGFPMGGMSGMPSMFRLFSM